MSATTECSTTMTARQPGGRWSSVLAPAGDECCGAPGDAAEVLLDECLRRSVPGGAPCAFFQPATSEVTACIAHMPDIDTDAVMEDYQDELADFDPAVDHEPGCALQRGDLEELLGVSLEDITQEQDVTLRQVRSAHEALGAHADDPSAEVDVLTSALQYLRGELDLDELAEAAVESDQTRRHAIVGAVLAGMPETHAARAGRLDRMTVRKMVGK